MRLLLLLSAMLLIGCASVEEITPANTSAPTSAPTATTEIEATPTPTQAATLEPTQLPTDIPSTEAAACAPMVANLTAYDEGLNDRYGPELAVDGDYSDSESRWSADGDGRWLMLDLGGEGTVIELATAWHKADERTAFFDIETSLDGKTWTVAKTWQRSQGNLDLHAIDLGEIAARYVRIVGRGNSSNMWNSLLEATVQTCGDVVAGGPATVPPTATPAPTPSPAPSPTPGDGTIPDIITNGTLWDLEGVRPDPLVDSQTLVFVPLDAQYTSPNGNGWRHEYKIRKDLRVAMTDTFEEFQATVKVEMTDGGKTIVAQYHAGGLGTIVKVYVSDTSESGFFDSLPANGIFDVYVRMRNTAGVEQKFTLGTIESGDSFGLRIVNDYGVVTVEAFGASYAMEVQDDPASYLKFGNYLQSQNPRGNVKCGEPGNSDSFATCYEQLGIVESTVTMTDVSYKREMR